MELESSTQLCISNKNVKQKNIKLDPIENVVAMEKGDAKPLNLKATDAERQAPLMSRPVHISDFPKYYELLTRNDDKELKNEFKTFDKFDENNTCYHGSISENDPKNRYKNIVPFDHSRVKLSVIGNDPHTDYINGSYIHGYHKPRVFIAAQAPLYTTVNDWWRMIWEKKCTIIVNLTKTTESGKIKSIVYWPSPEEQTVKYDNISVTRTDKIEAENFKLYTFNVVKDNVTREVFMFNYTAWPDYDVPTSTNNFVTFILNIRYVLHVRPPPGPVLTHCSAGTGRTGAFIGIMNSLDRLLAKDDLDLLGLVGSLRQQRRKMVFTDHQYKFIHKVMLDLVSKSEYEDMKQSGFRKKLELGTIAENVLVSSGSSSDEEQNTKV